MKIVVNGKLIKLKDEDVRIAQKLANSFISHVKDSAAGHNQLGMYITTMVVMHNMTGDVLKAFEPEILQALTVNDTEDGGEE